MKNWQPLNKTAPEAITRVEHTRKLLRRISWLCLSLLASACSPTKAYHGPLLPEKELASAWFSPRPGISIRDMSLAGFDVGIFDWGARIRPGETSFSARIVYDLSTCDDDRREQGFCVPRTERRHCTGSFQAEVGKDYKIEATLGGMWVIEQASSQVVGAARCTN